MEEEKKEENYRTKEKKKGYRLNKKKEIQFSKWEWEFRAKRNDPESKEEKMRYRGKLKWIWVGSFIDEICWNRACELQKKRILVVLGDFKKQEDSKLYGRLPDYDDSQRYDFGQEDILRQVALRIYDNSHKPSWQTLKHHFLTVKFRKNYLGK